MTYFQQDLIIELIQTSIVQYDSAVSSHNLKKLTH